MIPRRSLSFSSSRWLVGRSIGFVVLSALAVTPVRAQPKGPPPGKGPPAQPKGPPPKPEPPAPADDPATQEARRHFQSGLKLFNDGNFQGALAEFDAAYKLKPGPASLKNIALCQKALFRYADAADTLDKVLSRHGSELSAEERKTIEDTIAELKLLVGTVSITVTPAEARVLVDGRVVDKADQAAGIRLNTGEHTITADMAGYTKVARTVRVAGGGKEAVDLTLQPTGGFVVVTTSDPNAAIAIDRKALSFSEWRGPLPPGRHFVQVYREGFDTFEQVFFVELGKTVEIKAVLKPGTGDEGAKPGKGDAKTPQQKGFYALLSLTALGLRSAPENLENDPNDASGSSVGVRAGYRVWTPVAVELLLEGGRHQVKDACDNTLGPDEECRNENKRDFTLDSIRVGPNLRIMSGGEKLRFTAVAGAGAVRHEIKLDAPGSDSDPLGQPAGEAKGWDPYFLLEVGAQYNWGHVLLELDGLIFIDGASNTKGKYDSGGTRPRAGEPWTPYKDSGGLIMGGIGLRGGWSEWQPSKK